MIARMPIDRAMSVRDLAVDERWEADLAQHGLTESGRSVRLLFSEKTGQVYTSPVSDETLVLEIYGRVETLPEALELRDRCPRDATGRTLVDALRFAFE